MSSRVRTTQDTETVGDKPPAAPKGTQAAGRRLWRSLVDEYDFDEHELALLRQAVRTADLLDRLEAEIQEHPVIARRVRSGSTVTAVNPAVVEVRHQRETLAKLLASLRLPSGDQDDLATAARGHLHRPQRRNGTRGPYGIRGAVQ